jgi:selenocysteine lyase/cysteine desulfurase
MGCEETASLVPPLWEEYRDQFPVAERFLYLNHAAVAPLSKAAADAMKLLTEDAWRYGALHYSAWLEACEGVRQAGARLIGAHRDEIAILKNTSEGLATIALGLDWRPGDRVVGFREEFPANIFPWKRLERKGVAVEWLSVADPLERIDQACRGARLLAISFVQYLGGQRADLLAIGEICARRGCLLAVDAIQGLGAFPIDVRKARIQALAADGHKWLLGPEGCAVLYVQKDLQDSIEPVEFGWTNVANHHDYASRDMTLRADAGRYECGALNTVGCFGLRAAIEFLLAVGIDRIATHVQALGDRIAAGVAARGYQVLGQRTPASGAGIVSFRKEGLDANHAVSRLREQGIIAAARQGWIRASPHFYIAPGEIDRLLEALP